MTEVLTALISLLIGYFHRELREGIKQVLEAVQNIEVIRVRREEKRSAIIEDETDQDRLHEIIQNDIDRLNG